MSKNIAKKVVDITGTELMPGEPLACLGNGEQGFECCCDECDYYLLCFPEFDSKTIKEILPRIKFISHNRVKRTKNFNNSSSFSYRKVTYFVEV